MKTFFNIIQKVTNSSIIRYPDEPLKINCGFNIIKTEQNDIYISANIYSLICKIYKEYNISQKQTFITKFASSKFISLNVFLNNPFNSDKIKNNIFNAFSKAQRIYFAFVNFVNIYKSKKNPKVVTDDLSMTPLDMNNKNTFTLVQQKSIYLFSLNDLIRIIETAIGNSPSFFSDPFRPKNPFNNEEFDDATLYNIYFKMKECGRVMSTIFHLYFLANFNNKVFVINNEAFLREYSIKKYVLNSPAICLYQAIIEMIKTHIYTKKLSIHKDFPKELLVEIFRPFLYYYYIINYDIKGTHKISKYRKILYLKLKQFYEYNKTFGRKIIKLTPDPFRLAHCHNVNTACNLNLSLLPPLPPPTTPPPITPVQTTIVKRLSRIIQSKITFNSNHISFHNIDITGPQIDNNIHEGANLLYYFGTHAYNDDDDDDYDEDEDEDEEDDAEEEVVEEEIEEPEIVEVQNDNIYIQSDDADDECDDDDDYIS